MNQRYKVIMDYSYENFITSVNHFIDEGYQPIGGISVVIMKLNNNDDIDPKGEEKAMYHQALYR